MGKWGKYLKHYNAKWEKEAALKNWLQPSSEDDVMRGKPEAHCKLCDTHLRAHHSDLLNHAKTAKHKDKERSLNRSSQRSLHEYGHVDINNEDKAVELKLVVFTALHCPVKTIDHLSAMLKVLGKGTPLEKVRLHRTKCSKLISAVVSPAFLTDLIRDLGSSEYAIIADESTDVSTTKFMGLCVRYFSVTKKKMVTNFLGLIQVASCTGEALAEALKEYLKTIGLPLMQLRAIGTDGASSMCGEHNSFFTHLRKDVPHLQIITCICHSLDKCAQYAYRKMPDQLSFLLQETSFWYAHSNKRWNEYSDFYKERNGGTLPNKLQKLCKTRWLTWLPVSSVILDQWCDLRDFFRMKSATMDDYRAKELAKFFCDNSNLLMLTFLKTILREVQVVSLAFERNDADITKLFADLRNLVFSLCGRVLKPSAIAETTRPGVLRSDEVAMLKVAFQSQDNLLPIDRVNFGDAFRTLLPTLNLNDSEILRVRQRCGDYLLTLCKQLLARLPPNIAVIGKIRNLTPRMILTRVGRPTFDQLPLNMLILIQLIETN